MDSFFKMVDVQTVLFIYMAVGFFCRKKGIFNDAARDKLTDFVVLITLPCMIFESFHMEFSLESLKQGGVAVLIATAMAAAALLLIFPHSDAPGDQNFIDAWSWVLFGGVFVGSWRKINPILLIVLSAAAGILIYYVF